MALLELLATKVNQGDFTLRVPQLKVEPGRLYTLQGQNGAGKSTLLRHLALLKKSEAGQVLFSGRPICWRKNSLKSLRRQHRKKHCLWSQTARHYRSGTVQED